MNTLPATLRDGAVAELADGAKVALGRLIDLPDGAAITIGIRPEHVEVGDGPLTVSAGTIEVLGSETIVHAQTAGGADFALALRGISRVKTDDALPVRFPAHFVHVFDDTGRAVGLTPDWRERYVN